MAIGQVQGTGAVKSQVFCSSHSPARRLESVEERCHFIRARVNQGIIAQHVVEAGKWSPRLPRRSFARYCTSVLYDIGKQPGVIRRRLVWADNLFLEQKISGNVVDWRRYCIPIIVFRNLLTSFFPPFVAVPGVAAMEAIFRNSFKVLSLKSTLE